MTILHLIVYCASCYFPPGIKEAIDLDRDQTVLSSRRKTIEMKLLLSLALLLALALCIQSATEEWDCSDSYEGKCHQCPYSEKDQTCHGPGPSTVYLNGVIYTVDQSKANWAE